MDSVWLTREPARADESNSPRSGSRKTDSRRSRDAARFSPDSARVDTFDIASPDSSIDVVVDRMRPSQEERDLEIRESANIIAARAIAEMDAGNADRAIEMLDSAIILVPDELSFRYEKAYAYYVKKDFESALAAITPYLEDSTATDLFFQLASTLSIARDDTIAAVATLTNGLERFPKSGRLHLERGNIDAMSGRYQTAVEHYEEGMRVEPAFASNYYRATLILANSSEPLWGIVYGEMFMNLERATERTAEIGVLLYNTYRRTISAGGDSTFAVRFSTNTSTAHLKGEGRPEQILDEMSRPEVLYELTAMQSLAVSDYCRKSGVKIDCLDQFRTEFTRRWFGQNLHEKFPSRLFDWHKLLIDLGYFDEYNHWLLGAGDPESFYAWVDEHAAEFDLFQKWFRVNGMSMR